MEIFVLHANDDLSAWMSRKLPIYINIVIHVPPSSMLVRRQISTFSSNLQLKVLNLVSQYALFFIFDIYTDQLDYIHMMTILNDQVNRVRSNAFGS